MQLYDVITVGDAIVDLLVSLPKDDPNISLDTQKEKALITIGAKIPVTDSSFSIGGNATHVAIGLSRLGLRAALAAELGTDEFAEKILKDLEKEKVVTDLLIQTKGALSTFTVSITLGQDRTTFVRHITRNHDFLFTNVSTNWVYLTSMGEKWEETYKKTLAFVKKSGAKLAFNPGSMQLKAGADSFKEITSSCDILFVNKEEAERILYGEVLPPEKKEQVESLLFRLQRAGPKIAVITDGENGSYAIDEDGKVYSQKVFHETITEKTGAGDAFSTGFLAGMIAGKDIQTCLLWGTADAAGVVSKHGGQEGLLTSKQLKDMIEKNS